MAISDMAAKGQRKLSAKAGSMVASWNASKGRAAANFRAVGFGPTRTRNYEAGLASAEYHAPDPSKWARNWVAKMQE